MIETAPLAKLIGDPYQPRGLSVPLTLSDNKNATIHVAVFPRTSTAVRVTVFEKKQRLAEWCRQHQVFYGITGGFFSRHTNRPLGKVWMRDLEIESEPFGKHWADKRSGLWVDGWDLKIVTVSELPKEPRGDFVTAGPALVRNGQAVVSPDCDFEGIPETWEGELDDDWTQWRAARTAIGYDAQRIWTVVSDGPITDPVWRQEVGAPEAPSVGLYLWEMAEVMLGLGATDALNLDGGGGSTLVYDQVLANKPVAGKFDAGYAPGEVVKGGRPIHTALVFLPR